MGKCSFPTVSRCDVLRLSSPDGEGTIHYLAHALTHSQCGGIPGVHHPCCDMSTSEDAH
jgi:hypothetical protein